MFPKLKGKAGCIKHFIPAITDAFAQFMTVGSLQHVLLLEALKSSLAMDRVIDDHPGNVVLPAHAARSFTAHGFNFLMKYTELSNWYNANGYMLFDFTVKAHMICHILLRAGDLNPRRSWCFSGERMMLIMRKVAQSCVRAIQPRDLSSNMLRK